MIKFVALAAASALAMSAIPALSALPASAQLGATAGVVTVNGAPPKTGPLQAGDVVRTSKASSAVLVFADGCRITVAQNSTVTVGTVSPCAAKTAGAGAAAAVGTGVALGTSTVVVGTVVVVGAVAGVLAAASQSSSSP